MSAKSSKSRTPKLVIKENKTPSPQPSPITPREAFVAKDIAASKYAHQHLDSPEAMSEPAKYSKTAKAIIFGGFDGVITTFAIVTAVVGAGLSTVVILVLGLAVLAASSLSMGLGELISSWAEVDYFSTERCREEWECEFGLEGEKAEMIKLYSSKGIPVSDAAAIVEVMAKHKKFFVDVMMVEELGLTNPSGLRPGKNGLTMSLSFVLFGAVPLTAYLITHWNNWSAPTALNTTFYVTCALTFCILMTLGLVKAKLTSGSMIGGGLFMVFAGACAATAAYAVGCGLRQFVMAIPPHMQ